MNIALIIIGTTRMVMVTIVTINRIMVAKYTFDYHYNDESGKSGNSKHNNNQDNNNFIDNWLWQLPWQSP